MARRRPSLLDARRPPEGSSQCCEPNSTHEITGEGLKHCAKTNQYYLIIVQKKSITISTCCRRLSPWLAMTPPGGSSQKNGVSSTMFIYNSCSFVVFRCCCNEDRRHQREALCEPNSTVSNYCGRTQLLYPETNNILLLWKAVAIISTHTTRRKHSKLLPQCNHI